MQEVTKDQDGRFTEIALADGQQIYEKAILATYMSAAQFPMDMKYFFKPFYSEEELTIYVEHDEDPPSIKIPADLLEDPNDLSEDETMVGRPQKGFLGQ